MNIIDLISLFPLLLFGIKGLQTGIIKQVFGLVGMVIAILVSLKFTQVAISELDTISSPFLPLIAHLVIFIITLMLVHYAGQLIEKVLKIGQINFLNRFAGLLFGLLKAILLVSLVLWLLNMAHLLPPEATNNSIAYSYFINWSPLMVEGIGKIIPVFSTLITDISNYFEGIAKSIN